MFNGSSALPISANFCIGGRPCARSQFETLGKARKKSGRPFVAACFAASVWSGFTLPEEVVSQCLLLSIGYALVAEHSVSCFIEKDPKNGKRDDVSSIFIQSYPVHICHILWIKGHASTLYTKLPQKSSV